jgi:glycosyltransferase involved in cell wall biosynthesis
VKKPKLSFYTNIPTPNQLCFFKELAILFDLKVIYYAATESNRQWNFTLEEAYEVVVLKDNFIARLVQKWIVDFHFSWRIFSECSRDKNAFVIVSGGYWTPNSVIALLFNKMRSKKIAYFSEALFPAKNGFARILKWLSLRILQLCCDALFCIGQRSSDCFEQLGVNIPKFTILYNLDPSPFQNLDSRLLASFTERYKPGGELVVLSSGSLIDRKGMDILIKSFKMIPSNKIRLLIIGEGAQRKTLQELAGTDDRIVFAGFQTPDEVPYFFGVADVFSFASRYDGWGLVINEAIAANVPVISSNKVNAAIELISAPGTGILCESENIASFKEAMEQLLFSAGKRLEIKNNMQPLVPLISSSYNARKVYDIFLNQLN